MVTRRQLFKALIQGLGKETVSLEETAVSSRFSLVVRQDGAIRGILADIDVVNRTMKVPDRPPSKWSIG